jgi:Cdc6-like AAA superfamily ATPase
MKAQYPNNLVVETTATYNGLKQKQKQLFDLLMNHYRRSLNQEAPNQILLHLDGQGGTGKTHVIMYLCQEFDQLASQFEPGVGNRIDRRSGMSQFTGEAMQANHSISPPTARPECIHYCPNVTRKTFHP